MTKQEDKIGRVKRPTQTHSQWLNRETKPLLCDTQLCSLSKNGQSPTPEMVIGPFPRTQKEKMSKTSKSITGF